MAEAPKEALPHNCRPDFGAVWSTTAKFKVNESYKCRYTLGSTKADIYSDKLFNCTAEDPSIIEMLKRIFVLFSKFCKSKDFSSWWMLGYAAAGVVAGVLSSILITIAVRILRGVFLAAARRAYSKMVGLKELVLDFKLLERFL
ncbi:unnamed protein product [Triticum turgidum subsp. durum]|uniref:Uncharacterized protein n=1 Tax=Triticum turgidum subsp. durum TaxID=4567 RepID=A0A9R1PZN7_TRITD|nr:unnamed protein product [Triticum turgidum subsp. durum]